MGVISKPPMLFLGGAIFEITPMPVISRIYGTDYLTRWPEAKAVPDAGANTLAQFIFEEIICRHGTSKIILCDQGRNFISETI